MIRSFKTPLFLFILFFTFACTGFAGEIPLKNISFSDYFPKVGEKFGRSVRNIATSPAEIPCGIRNELSERPKVAYLTGIGRGTFFMFRRLLTGVLELVTFFLPEDPLMGDVCEGN